MQSERINRKDHEDDTKSYKTESIFSIMILRSEY